MGIFQNINDEELTKILSRINTKTKEYLRGEQIFSENDLCDSIAIVKRGTIKAIHNYSDGHEKIIRILNKDEIIGITLLFSANPKYKASFIADTITTVQIISKKDLLYLMEINPIIMENVLRIISDYSIRLNEHIKLLSYKTIRSKLCAFLFLEYQRTKMPSFVIEYTKTELAALLNVERPSLSFELSKLINEGIIANQNKLYTIININRLEKEL